jgi:hypothetical protein
MRQHLSQISVLLAVAVLGVACGGRTSSTNMSAERTSGPLKANESPSMTLIGCVRPAPTKADGAFVLDRVTMPPGELQPESSSNTTALVPRGSWVRLAGPDMHQYLGKEVLVSGNLAAAPAGTTGHSGTAQPGDYVRWGSTPADVPLLAVETVKEQPGGCKTE